jgi:hypothetical protein
MKRIIRLTESDLSRIVRRVINEQDTVDNEYCDINFYSKHLKSNYDNIQGIIDKLVSAENATYDCDAHKYYIRQMLVGMLFDVAENQIQSGPFVGDKYKNFINFLMNRYDFLK